MTYSHFVHVFFLCALVIPHAALSNSTQLDVTYMRSRDLELLPHFSFQSDAYSAPYSLPNRATLPMRSNAPFGFSEDPQIPTFCGPSPKPNVMTCVSMDNYPLGDFPVPGNVTTTPVFVDGSWFVGTSKGFFIRSSGLLPGGAPNFAHGLNQFWGNYSRWHMRSLRRTQQKKEGTVRVFDDVDTASIDLPLGWRWYHAGTSEFVGKPVVLANKIFVMSANLFLHTFDIESGKLLWTKRVAAEGNLRLLNPAIVAVANMVIVGADEGRVVGLDPEDGKELFVHRLPAEGHERFRSIVAPPHSAVKSIIVSTADGVTQRFDVKQKSVEWSYAGGSSCTPAVTEQNVYIGETKGSVVALDLRSGSLKWKVLVSGESALASVLTLPGKNVVIAIAQNGKISVLDAGSGKLLMQTPGQGDVLGAMTVDYVNPLRSDFCMNFAEPALRCFLLRSKKLVSNALSTR